MQSSPPVIDEVTMLLVRTKEPGVRESFPRKSGHRSIKAPVPPRPARDPLSPDGIAGVHSSATAQA